MTHQVLIVDDHPIVRQGIRRLIEKEPGFGVCGEAEDAPEALDLIEELDPGVVLVDLSLKETSGFDLILDIKHRWPDKPVLVLSMYNEEVYAERMLRAGASGYIMKQEAPKRVIEALRTVLGGNIYVSDKVSATILQRLSGRSTAASPVDALSDRELQVFQMLGEGMNHHEIAERLMLSVKTIESHVEHIKQKMNLGSGRELLQRAIEWVVRSQQAGPSF